ncbi:hypothetical protein ACXITB_02400 [Proteus mirabilis]
MIAALNFTPKNWYQQINGSSSSNISFDSNGNAIIKSVEKEAAYIYMPVEIGSGETITVSVSALVKSGKGVIYTNESTFGGDLHNKLTLTSGVLKTFHLTHTSKLYANSQILYIKIGSDSSMNSDLIISNISVSRNSSKYGCLRDLAFGFFSINSGSASLHEKYPSLNIKTVNLDNESVKIEMDNTYVVSSAGLHKNLLPLMFVSDFTSLSNIVPKITNYDQYTNIVTVRFISITNGEYINPLTANIRFIFKAQVP